MDHQNRVMLQVQHTEQHEPCGIAGLVVSYWSSSFDGWVWCVGHDPDCPLSACVAAIEYELWRLTERDLPLPRKKKPSESERKRMVLA